MEKNKWLTLLLSFTVLLIIILTKGKTIIETTTSKVWDYVSEKRINTLHPFVRDKAREFINQVEIETGIKLRVSSATRTFPEQNKLYAKGRTAPGKIVTNAKAGESFHNYGLAIDVVEILHGAANWQTDWNKIARIGKRIGFEWGGHWNTPDKPHFQMTYGNSIAQLQTRYSLGNLPQGYVALA